MGRRRTGAGEMLAPAPEAMAQRVIDQLTHQTALALLETAFSEEEDGFGVPPTELARHVLTQKGLGGHRGSMRIDVGLNLPIVGLGASAASYYPAVGARLGCEAILPAHGGVANAIGAVVGRVTMRRQGTVTAPSEGRYRVHFEAGPEDFADGDMALDALETHLRALALADAQGSGAEDIHVHASREVKSVQAEARDVFIEALITVEASGRPRIAT